MTGRNNRGVRPGRGISAAIAVAALLALGAQGAVGAPTERKPRDNSKPAASQIDAKKQAAAAKPSTGTVTRSVGSVQVAIDPRTGKVQQPTAEQAAALAAQLDHMLSRDPESLVATELPDGTLMISLDDTYEEVAMASVDPRGHVRLQCVNDAAQARAILAGTAHIPADTPVYTRAKASIVRGASKAGRDPVEKE